MSYIIMYFSNSYRNEDRIQTKHNYVLNGNNLIILKNIHLLRISTKTKNNITRISNKIFEAIKFEKDRKKDPRQRNNNN